MIHFVSGGFLPARNSRLCAPKSLRFWFWFFLFGRVRSHETPARWAFTSASTLNLVAPQLQLLGLTSGVWGLSNVHMSARRGSGTAKHDSETGTKKKRKIPSFQRCPLYGGIRGRRHHMEAPKKRTFRFMGNTTPILHQQNEGIDRFPMVCHSWPLERANTPNQGPQGGAMERG